MGSSLPICLPIRPSVKLTAVLFLVHVAAVVSLWSCQLHVLFKTLGSVLVFLSGVWGGWSVGWFNQQWPDLLMLNERGALSVGWGTADAIERISPAQRRSIGLATSWLILLPLWIDEGKTTLLLCRTGGENDPYRRLCVWMRQNRQKHRNKAEEPTQ